MLVSRQRKNDDGDLHLGRIHTSKLEVCIRCQLIKAVYLIFKPCMTVCVGLYSKLENLLEYYNVRHKK